MSQRRTILLTGATGFVGSALYPALQEKGKRIRCLTRDPDAARKRFPDREWIEGDLDRPETVKAALQGCDAAFFLIHRMREGVGFRDRERRTAASFAEEAERMGLRRIVYLGGMAPEGAPSEHLASRLEVGEALRNGKVPALELRAGIIIGDGSLSWLILRDLAARLPLMVLPSWLESRMQPVGIRDVVTALVGGLDVPLAAGGVFDLPGPDLLTGEEALLRTADALGLKRPIRITVPFLSLGLSSHWLRWVTRADWSIARELVGGLAADLVAKDDAYWHRIGHETLESFDQAARAALAGEDRRPMAGWWGTVERAMRRYRPALPAS